MEVEGEEMEVEGEEMEVEEVEDEIIEDDFDEAINETEAEENTTTKGIGKPEALSSI
jgi:hypothetical protein